MCIRDSYETLPCEARPNSLRRRTIARRLAESARTMPQLTADMQVDLGNLLAARSRLNAAEQAAGRASVSVLSFVAAAVCRLLPQHAELNACLLYTSPSPRDRTRSRMPSSA